MPPTRDDDDRTDPGPRDKPDGWARAFDGRQAGGGDFTFDFDAFERSEAEAARPRPTAVPEVAKRPERRAVVARNWLPPGDSVVETRPVGNTTVVSLRGRINESFRGAELGQSLRGIVVFDLSQVDRISSFGVKGWLQMMEQARFTEAYFYRCSEAVVNQITMMRNFCGAGRIHSLLVPYQCGACGEEFSAVYEAVPDREVILGRSPVPVECPRCAAAATMSDDPWAYLSLDEHLLEQVSPELAPVIDHLAQGTRVDPLEKFVSDDETRIRINAPLDPRLRLTRALTGLEGKVVFDLTPRPDIAPAGVQRLLEAIRGLDEEVSEVWIDGANRPVLEALIADPPPRTWVSTAWLTAVSSAGLRRPILVEVRKKRHALLRGELPVVEGGRGPFQFEDAQIVFEAARSLVPASAGTPTGAHATPIPAAVLQNTQARLQALQMQQMQMQMQLQHQLERTGLTPVRAPAPAGMSIPVWQLVLFGAVTMSVAAVAFVIVFIVVAKGLMDRAPQAAVVAPTDVSVVSAPAAMGWQNGSPLPPPWVEQVVLVDAQGVKVVGMASGATAEAAADRSREQALYRLVQHVSDRLAAEPVSAGLGTDPGEDHAGEVAARFLADVGAWATPVRVNQDVKREAAGLTVATQYQLDAAALERVVAYYQETSDFRGLVVGRRFPFRDDATPSRAVVVSAETWLEGVSTGDAVVQVGREAVSTFEAFTELAPAGFRDTAEGAKLVILVDHDGSRSRLEFAKPASSGRKEAKTDLMDFEPNQ